MGWWPARVVWSAAVVVVVVLVVTATIDLTRGLEHPYLIGLGPLSLALSMTSVWLSRGRHPAVEPSGRQLEPAFAHAAWPQVFTLGRVYALRDRRWARRLGRSRLVLQPGGLWVDRPGRELPRPGAGPFQLGGSGVWIIRRAYEVRLVQPLVSRKGETGLVVHLQDGTPLFLFTDESREAMLTEFAAAGFAVDGTEQAVTRRWVKSRPVGRHSVPAA